jgi:hypothetical protein
MIFFKPAVFSLLVFGLFSMGNCQQQVSATLKQLLMDRISAIAKKDTFALEKICTPDYRMISSSGNTYTLPQLKKVVIGSESQIKQSNIVSYQPFLISDEHIAFAIFEIEEEFVDQNQRLSPNSLIITEIYRKEKSKWKIQLSHISQKICTFPK